MRAKKAKLIRRIMSTVPRAETPYEHVITPRMIQTPGGVLRVDMVTVVSTGPRRAYRLGKAIYKRYGVLPRVG